MIRAMTRQVGSVETLVYAAAGMALTSAAAETPWRLIKLHPRLAGRGSWTCMSGWELHLLSRLD